MTSFFRAILPVSSARSEDGDDDYSADYSFAMEYKGPPVSHDVPEVVPIDICRIPTASLAATTGVMSKSFPLPVVQPIVRNSHPCQKASEEFKSVSETTEPQDSVRHSGKLGVSGRCYSTILENGSHKGGSSAILHNDQSSTSSGTLWFSDARDDSNRLSESSDVEDLGDECKAGVICNNDSNSKMSPPRESAPRPRKPSSEISSHRGKMEDSAIEASGQRNRISAVTFLEVPSSYENSEETDGDELAMSPDMRVASNHGKKGMCHRCHKKNRFAEKEVCIVCCAMYCRKCVIRAMGSMPEGRKCINCIGCRIDESKRVSLGKCSRMLKRLLDDGVKQIIQAEISCEVNRLPPRLIWVNGKHLCKEELVQLQSCPNPPKKLRPGRYWYDKDSGFWGKEGKKPCQIISADMAIDAQLKSNASNGDTKVTINGREVTSAECWMLQAAGIHCEGEPNFWLSSDGSCMHEGMNNVVGNLWGKKTVKIVCAALSLPFPSANQRSSGEDAGKDMNNTTEKNIGKTKLNKLLLVGGDQSGTSTIFQQAKILYNVPFSEDEKLNIKQLIQRNVYSYICILLEGCASFQEEYLTEMTRKLADKPGPSGIFEQIEQSNIYSLSPRLKYFSQWLLEIVTSGQLDVIIPAATRETSPLVEQLWKDKAFQATYKRRNELPALPRVANYFLDRAVEISRVDYEPSQMDILYADGIASSNRIASMEFSFPNSSHERYMESLDQNDSQVRYQLIRVHASGLRENCRWLDMFEDVDLILYCVSLTDYDEYYEDINGNWINKMLATKKHFETTITHPALSKKTFLLVLNKLDLLEQKIDQVPLSQCAWFQDYNPVISLHPHNPSSNNNPPLTQRAFHYVAVKFKKLFTSLTNRKLFVTRVTANESETIDKALRYGREIMKWNDEVQTVSLNECSIASTEPSTSV